MSENIEKHFTHLHLHTDYSLLDGAIQLDKLIEFGKKHKCRALAISDHGNIFAAVKFFEKCKKAGIKAIIGMEAYITESVSSRDINNPYYHLLLLVENEEGYRNLCRLIEFSFTSGFYFKPRIDYEVLKKFSRGLIATSSCLGGHIPKLIMSGKLKEAKDKISKMQEMFLDRYFLEVQPENQREQKELNENIFSLEKELGIYSIATADCHYVSEKDRYAHEVMLAIQTRHLMSDSDRMTFGDCLAYMRSPEEMLNEFSAREDVVWRTGEVADLCNFEFKTGKLFFPKFQLPEPFLSDLEFFKSQCEDGFKILLLKGKIEISKKEEYEKRLYLEIALIDKMGFVPYFLVVSDFIQWAKNNGIAVGPGRGSVAGSLVSWTLFITDIDPIKYNLLFERFLNPERVSMPDIDIDFCVNGRERVIQYVRDKYGQDRVGQIITFGTMMAKGAIKDVARALGFSFEDANMITNLIPDELKISIKDSIEQEPKLKNLIEKNEKIAELFDIAQRLEGMTRHASKHAAGIVISPEPIAHVLPIYIPAKSNEIVTQYAMTELDLLGFLKMDFLGLKNLTLITNVINLVKKNYGIDIDISMIPLDDKKVFELNSKGDTSGVFQLESDGIKDVLRKLQPACFEDIIAVNALYRPGPLGSGMVDDFIERKHGRQEVTYIFKELEEVLKETYGVIVYQEQVMKIASAIAGYSLAEADILRRAMGKKKADVMAEQRSVFVKRSVERGFEEKKSGELFDLMAYFAGYGFNKSHSAAYALIAYQTAYLKAHYLKEFMACLITLELGNPETTSMYINEVKGKNIKLLPPDINRSVNVFSCEGEAIRFGLLGVKNVGAAALESIFKERENGVFLDLNDFCQRIDLRVCNKRVLEFLIISGSFDNLHDSRAEMISNLDEFMKCAQDFKNNEESGQLSLFDEKTGNEEIDKKKFYLQKLIKVDEWSALQKLEKEKEALGIYLSNHPIDDYDLKFSIYGIKKINDVRETKNSYEVTRGAIISFREVKTKKGDIMAFAVIEDQVAKADIVIFPKIYQKYSDILRNFNLFIFSGDATETSNENVKIKVESIIPLVNFDVESKISAFRLKLNSKIRKDEFFELSKLSSKNGEVDLIFEFEEKEKKFEHYVHGKLKLDEYFFKFARNKDIEIVPYF
jgi:DNA polymerase-3 subunit alpha